MISEQTIESSIELIAKGEQDWLAVMAEHQPVLAAFLMAEEHEAFTKDETEYLYYLAVMCWMCFDETYAEIDKVDEDELAIREEQNWHRIDSFQTNNFKTIIDKIIPDHPEQEIIFYLEDALQLDPEDPDQPVTPSGQLPLFVTLLTFVDILSINCKGED